MKAFENVFPAVRGIQAGREYFVTMCPLKFLPVLFPDRDDRLRPELEAQRVINAPRVAEIARYVASQNDTYVLSAITASVDSFVTFAPASDEREPVAVGQLHIPMGARFIVHDGLHRCAALTAAVKADPTLGDESLCVVLYIDPGLKRSDQIFTDLKRHERKSARSLSILHDDRDELARLTRQMIKQVAVFSESTEMARTTISNRSRKLFTLSAIYHATTTLLAERKHDSFEANLMTAVDFWNEVAKRIPDWGRAARGEISPAELRKHCVHAHGIALSALARAGRSLIQQYPKTWHRKLGGLRKIDWSRSNTQLWEGRAMIAGRLSKARSCVVLAGNVIKQTLGVLLKEEEEALEKQLGGRSTN